MLLTLHMRGFEKGYSMTIKQLAYSTQQVLQSQTGVSFKRTHIYELLAASFSYRSYAALCANAVLLDADIDAETPTVTTVLISRLKHLGYTSEDMPLIAQVCVDELLSRQLRCIPLAGLYETLLGQDVQLQDTKSNNRNYFDFDDEEFDDDDFDDDFDVDEFGEVVEYTKESNIEKYQKSELLINELKAAAEQGNVKAHYVLAVIFRCKKPNGYLYEESLKGRKLNAIEQGWADDYVRMQPIYDAYCEHLRAAAFGGIRQAALECSSVFNIDSFYKMAEEGSGPVNSLAMAKSAPHHLKAMWLKSAALDGSYDALDELAQSGDKWALTRKAQQGDLYAVRELTEQAIETDMSVAWMWQYFALLCGTDLTESTMRVYHDGGLYDGQEYDDDFGGAMYAGGDEGLKLEVISADQDREAQKKAQSMFDHLEQA